MKNDAKEHAAEDKKKKESVDVRNQADSMVFQTKKQMEEMKDKLSDDDKNKLDAEIKKVEEAIASNNTDQMKSATESLSKVWNEIASKLYQQAGQQAGGPEAQQQTAGTKGRAGTAGSSDCRHGPYRPCYRCSPALRGDP